MTETRKRKHVVPGAALAVLVFCAFGSAALGLEGWGDQTVLRRESPASYALPIGPWAEGTMLTRQTEGEVEFAAWRIGQAGITTQDILSRLRDDLQGGGWRVLYECDTLACGGFDFRFSTRVLPEPEMHVDLGDFRFLSAVRGQGETAEYQSILISRSRLAGFVQRVLVRPVGAAPRPVALPEGKARPDSPLARRLEGGSVVLEDLDFQSGSGGLGPGPHRALEDLADYLKAHPDHRIALVGHTDASGAFDVNKALSLRRAEEVRARLIRGHGIDPDRIEAHGVGYLVPRASNLTEEGRALNRRVEATLISVR